MTFQVLYLRLITEVLHTWIIFPTKVSSQENRLNCGKSRFYYLARFKIKIIQLESMLILLDPASNALIRVENYTPIQLFLDYSTYPGTNATKPTNNQYYSYILGVLSSNQFSENRCPILVWQIQHNPS